MFSVMSQEKFLHLKTKECVMIDQRVLKVEQALKRASVSLLIHELCSRGNIQKMEHERELVDLNKIEKKYQGVLIIFPFES